MSNAIRAVARYAKQVQSYDEKRAAAAEHRDEAMRAAREDGATWREIATAAGMTEHGVRKALGYTRNQ